MTDRELNELIVSLRDEDNCNVLDDIDAAADALESLVDRLSALQSENVEKDREIAKLKLEKELMRQEWDESQAALSRVEAERDAAIKDSIVRCCGTCDAHTQGTYNGRCMVCALCECVPERLREYHKNHYSKSLWKWRGAQGEG